VGGRAIFSRLSAGRFFRSRKARRGQILVLAVVIFFLFFLVATALIDVYHLQEARNWGYRVAQQAALAGASGTGTKWLPYQPTATPMVETPTPGPPGCIDPVRIQLDADEARTAAADMVTREMDARGIDNYEVEIEVLPDFDGGTTTGWPPYPVRLGAGRGEWSAEHAAVGVFLSFDVQTFLMSVVGRGTVTIHVFAAAEAFTPLCPP